jgi:hypothetical protein
MTDEPLRTKAALVGSLKQRERNCGTWEEEQDWW